MSSSRTTYAFYSVHQIRELAGQALLTLRAAHENSDFDAPHMVQVEAGLGHRAAESALIYCSDAIAYLRDPSLVQVAIDIAEALAESEREPFDDHSGYYALRELAGTGRVTEQLAKLVDHPTDGIRWALASGFRPDSAESSKLLEKLCGDPSSEVRAVARERLENFKPLAWWVGAFSADPLEGLSTEDAERSKPVVDELAGHLRSRFFAPAVIEAILELAPKAPPVAACDAVLRVLQAVGHYSDEAMRRRCVNILAASGPIGLAALEELGQTHPSALARDIPALFVEALSESDVEPTLLRWLEQLKIRTDTDPDDYLARAVDTAFAKAIELHWPLQSDPLPVLETALARGAGPRPDSWDLAASTLGAALGKRGRLDVLAPRLSTQILRGFTGPWEKIAPGCREALARLATSDVRALADQALLSDEESAITWGLEQRLKATYDPAQDGTLAELALKFDDDPRLRPVMRKFRLTCVLPRARTELVEGKLAFIDAANIVGLCGRFYGGAVGMMSFRPTDPVLQSMLVSLADELAKLEPYLGPASARLPPSDAEWSAYRRAREAHDFKEDEQAWFSGLMALPRVEVLEPSDRAFVERAIAIAPKLKSERILAQLGWVLACCGEARDLDVFRRLLALCGPEDDFAPKELRIWEAEFVKRLGLEGKGRARFKVVGGDSGSS